MFKIVDAPSPRGTNKEKLYVPAKLFGSSGFAYDSAGGAPAEASTKSGLDTFIRILRTMSPDARHELIDGLCGNEAEDEEEPRDLEHIKNGIVPAKASDDPPPFEGRPKTGGAMDSRSRAAEKDFGARYPGAMDIKLNGASDGTRKRTKPLGPSSSESFAVRYPDAMKIKVYR